MYISVEKDSENNVLCLNVKQIERKFFYLFIQLCV